VIELLMVRRMAWRALIVSPLVIGGLLAWGGAEFAISGAVGIGMTVLNLWLSGRIIGGVAEHNPQLLMPAAMGAFVLGLLILTGIALGLRATDAVYFPVTGFTLVGTHMLVVLWEAAGAYGKVPPGTPTKTPIKARS
jgi:hypothetical protein